MFQPAAAAAHASIPAGLARQEQDRLKALRRLAKLRERAAAEIQRLLDFLDASDEYVVTELEDQVDDSPIDTDELEMGWTGVTAGTDCRFDVALDEGEADYDGRAADEEPDLGSHELEPAGAVAYLPSWSRVAGLDVEEQCDDEGATA